MNYYANYTTDELVHELMESNWLVASEPGIKPAVVARTRAVNRPDQYNHLELLRAKHQSPACSCDLGCICMIHHYQDSDPQSTCTTESRRLDGLATDLNKYR